MFLHSLYSSLQGTNVLTHLVDVYSQEAKRAVITAIDLLGRCIPICSLVHLPIYFPSPFVLTLTAKAVKRAGNEGAVFPLKKRDDLIGYVMGYMDNSINGLDVQILKTQVM